MVIFTILDITRAIVFYWQLYPHYVQSWLLRLITLERLVFDHLGNSSAYRTWWLRFYLMSFAVVVFIRTRNDIEFFSELHIIHYTARMLTALNSLLTVLDLTSVKISADATTTSAFRKVSYREAFIIRLFPLKTSWKQLPTNISCFLHVRFPIRKYSRFVIPSDRRAALSKLFLGRRPDEN